MKSFPNFVRFWYGTGTVLTGNSSFILWVF